MMFEQLMQTLTKTHTGHVDQGQREELPTFSGDYTQWSFFYDQFKALIDTNPKLAPIVKFKRLVAALDGEAARTVKAFQFKAENYPLVKQALEFRYGQPKLIFTDMYRQVQRHSQVDESNLEDFRAFVDQVKEMVKHLKFYRNMDITDPEPYLLLMESKLLEQCLVAWDHESMAQRDAVVQSKC